MLQALTVLQKSTQLALLRVKLGRVLAAFLAMLLHTFVQYLAYLCNIINETCLIGTSIPRDPKANGSL